MLAKELVELVQPYALRGIADWRNVANTVKRRAGTCLGINLAETPWDAQETLKANLERSGNKRSTFIPMPQVNHRGIKHCFFLPRRLPARGKDIRATFDLFLIVDDKNCLGFRFEPADPAPRDHCYPHVQMNRAMVGRSVRALGIPDWCPESYPAFPIRTSDPSEMFLSMATSIHGFGAGMRSLLQEVLPPGLKNKFINVLKAMLD